LVDFIAEKGKHGEKRVLANECTTEAWSQKYHSRGEGGEGKKGHCIWSSLNEVRKKKEKFEDLKYREGGRGALNTGTETIHAESREDGVSVFARKGKPRQKNEKKDGTGNETLKTAAQLKKVGLSVQD